MFVFLSIADVVRDVPSWNVPKAFRHSHCTVELPKQPPTETRLDEAALRLQHTDFIYTWSPTVPTDSTTDAWHRAAQTTGFAYPRTQFAQLVRYRDLPCTPSAWHAYYRDLTLYTLCIARSLQGSILSLTPFTHSARQLYCRFEVVHTLHSRSTTYEFIYLLNNYVLKRSCYLPSHFKP